MPLEEEVMGFLIGGVSIVMGITILTILFLWIKNRNKSASYVWTLLHLVFFSVAIYFLIKAMSSSYEHPMASEVNSLHIGISGIIWAVSMFCLLIGIYYFSKTRKYSDY